MLVPHLLVALFCHAHFGHALELTPPQNQWVRAEQSNVTLLCKATEKIRSCSWTTPYEKTYPLATGLVAEKGRLKYHVDDKDLECGVFISKIEEHDNGKWICNVGVVADGEVTSASGITKISIAVAPKSVSLESPFDQKSANVTRGGTTAAQCVVTEARPAPTFKWMVDDQDISGKVENKEVFVDDQGISTYMQTLTFKPEYQHHNKTLRCVIDHAGLIEEKSAEVTILLTGSPSTQTQRESLDTGGTVGVVIAVLVVVAVVAILIIVTLKRRSRTNTKAISDDAAEADVEADKTSQTESAHVLSEEENTAKEETKDGDAPEETQKKETRLQRMTNLLGFLKHTTKIEATDEEKAALENEEEKEVTEEKDVVEKPVASFGERVSAVFAKFKKSSEKTEVETQEMEEQEKKEEPTEEKGEQEKTVDGEEKMEEKEPEDKEEKPQEKKAGSETPV